MVELGMIKTAMDVLYKPDSTITRLLVMLLVNLTQLDAGSTSLLQVWFLRLHYDHLGILVVYIIFFEWLYFQSAHVVLAQLTPINIGWYYIIRVSQMTITIIVWKVAY